LIDVDAAQAHHPPEHLYPGRCGRRQRAHVEQAERREGLEIFLPAPPLRSVTSVSYVDVDGTTRTLDAGGYQVCGVGTRGQGYLVPAFGASWPATRDRPECVTIRYVGGYGDSAASVRESTKAALKLILGHLYENREATVPERASFLLPMGVSSLLDPERWGEY
jgi:uncharacterized phiE125 gp8 family phage protein